jgi:hypothetical protein
MADCRPAPAPVFHATLEARGAVEQLIRQPRRAYLDAAISVINPAVPTATRLRMVASVTGCGRRG